MDTKSFSVINDVVGTFAAVSVVAYLLSLTLDESTPQPLAQSPATHQTAVSTVAYFSSNSLKHAANIDVNQLQGCQVIGVNQTMAILTLDCSDGQVNSAINGDDAQQI